MSEGKNGDLLRVAQAVSDGVPVAWESERKARPDLEHALAELREIETMVVAQLGPEALDDSRTREIEAAAAVVPVATTSWGRLRLLDLLGRGGYGEVYRAHDPVLQIDVALKIYRASEGDPSGSALLDEARRLARVRHPNVVVLHGADRHDGQVGIWMELLHGKTLEQWLGEQGTLGAEEAARVGRDLCRALAAVHAAGIVHQDVKTQNVMREKGGRIVLMDFGAGRALGSHDGEKIVGTPLVMAPELLRGGKPSRASDIYSLGVLLYRLVTARYPVEAETLAGLRDRQAAGDAVSLRDLRPDLPVDFIRVVENALSSDPAARFSTAGEMERALSGGASETRTAPSKRAAWRPLAVLAAAAVIVTVIVVWQDKRKQHGSASAPASSASLGPDTPSPAAPPSTPASPPAAAPLVASAKLFRVTAQGQERLVSGSRIRPGDELQLEFESAERVYLYVLDQDAAGEAFVLFPAPGLDHGNPLAGRVAHRLPGTQSGKTASWEVSSAHGQESVFAIASRTPLRVLERDMAKFPRASEHEPVVYGSLGDSTLLALRGIGKIAVHVAVPVSASRPGISRALADVPDDASGGVWSWAIDMENPQP